MVTSCSQYQSKVEKIQNDKICHWKCHHEGTVNIIKEFEKIVKVPYVKRNPNHDPNSSYYHLVGFITECMLRCGEENQHVHGGYAEETAPSLSVNDTDEDELKKISCTNLYRIIYVCT